MKRRVVKSDALIVESDYLHCTNRSCCVHYKVCERCRRRRNCKDRREVLQKRA